MSISTRILAILDVTLDGSKINLITHKYEMFEMEEDETINTMYNWFNVIILGLKGLGKVIGMVEFHHKVLLSLPKE